jgi:hypothetical protein
MLTNSPTSMNLCLVANCRLRTFHACITARSDCSGYRWSKSSSTASPNTGPLPLTGRVRVHTNADIDESRIRLKARHSCDSLGTDEANRGLGDIHLVALDDTRPRPAGAKLLHHSAIHHKCAIPGPPTGRLGRICGEEWSIPVFITTELGRGALGLCKALRCNVIDGSWPDTVDNDG